MTSPSDLTISQRWTLVGTAVVAHVVIGAALILSRPAVDPVVESSPITVSLIAPVQAPPVPPKPEPEPPKPKEIRPPDPVKPKPRVVSSQAPSQNQIQADPEPVKQPVPDAPPPTPVQAPPAQVAAAPVAPPQPKMIPASAVSYLIPPDPIYPPASRRLGEYGVVQVKVLIDETGRPVDVQVVKSSGFDRLDKAAVAAMKKTRMKPASEGGVPRQAWAVTSINFDLQE